MKSITTRSARGFRLLHVIQSFLTFSQARKSNGSWKIPDEQIRRLEEVGVWWDKPDPQESNSLTGGTEDVTHLKRTTIQTLGVPLKISSEWNL